MIETTECPNVEELYVTAGNASNLTVDAERRGAGDMLIAAGWSPSRLGAAILRLHSEWGASKKPQRPTREAIEALAHALPRMKGKLNLALAKQQAADWYAGELIDLASKLMTLPAVRGQLAVQAARWGIEDPVAVAAASVRYWLDQVCGACDGRRWQMVPGTPALSNRACPACHGSGVAAVPHGQDGRRLVNYIDECVMYARGSIKKRLRATMERG